VYSLSHSCSVRSKNLITINITKTNPRYELNCLPLPLHVSKRGGCQNMVVYENNTAFIVRHLP
jgi:hypothetical protein